MTNNADKNNTRELSLQVCSGFCQLNREFDLFLIIITLNLKQGRGKNEQEMAYSTTKKVQDNPCLKENAPSIKQTPYHANLSPAEDICKTPILFCKVFLHNVSLPLASLKPSWKAVGGTGGKRELVCC